MVIIGLIAVSALFGLYRGFVSSVLNTGGCLVSLGLSFWLYPKAAALIQGDASLQRTLLTYTDAARRLGDKALADTSVTQLTAEKITEIVSKANLPEPLSGILRSNLENQIFTGISSVSDYISATILTVFVNIICFLLVFAAVYVVLSVSVNLIRAVFRFPVLKQLDSAAGGLFGVLRGVVLVFALFTLIPLVETMLPLQNVNELIDASRLAPIFNNGSLVTAIMNGRLF